MIEVMMSSGGCEHDEGTEYSTAMIAILSSIGIDAPSNSVPLAIDRSCQLSPEPIDGFSGVYRWLLHSYPDIHEAFIRGSLHIQTVLFRANKLLKSLLSHLRAPLHFISLNYSC